MSRDYQEKFLLEQIAEYDDLLREHAGAKGANRNLIKTIEKQKAARVERLKNPAGRGQEGRRAGLRRTRRRPRLHRRGPLLQEPGDADQDGPRRGHPDRRLGTGFRRLHESPLPGRAAPRPRRHLRHRHADIQYDGRDVHDAAIPRSRGTTQPRDRAFRRLGGHLRRGRRHDGNHARTVLGFGPAAGSPNSPTCRNSSRCSGLSPTSRRPRCSTCRDPAWKTGKPIVIACPMSDEQQALQQELVERYERIAVAESRPEGGQRPGHHHRRPQTGDRRADALGHGPGFPGIEDQPTRRERRRRSGNEARADTRHADDLLRHGRESDHLGLFALRGDHRQSWSPTASPATRSPPSATPSPTPRNRPSSRRSATARCAC